MVRESEGCVARWRVGVSRIRRGFVVESLGRELMRESRVTAVEKASMKVKVLEWRVMSKP